MYQMQECGDLAMVGKRSKTLYILHHAECENGENEIGIRSVRFPHFGCGMKG